jgi:hypothetical protein
MTDYWQTLRNASVQPFRFPCVECLGSRDDQITETLRDEEGQPLCRRCWEIAYGKESGTNG